jgi:hypothetical protein
MPNAPSPKSDRKLDLVFVLGLFALVLLTSPLLGWWAASDSPWYMPYLVWALLIALGAWLQRRRGLRDL